MKKSRVILVIVLSFSFFVSCESNETSNNQEDFVEGEVFEYDGESYSFQTDQSDIDKIYKLGLEAVTNNDRDLYDKVVRQYKLSRFPNRGISIVELMLIRNNYNKAYYDKVLLYGYKSKPYYNEKTEEKLINYLTKSKVEGYKWGEIEVFGKLIRYEDIVVPLH